MLEVKDIVSGYGKVDVLHNLSFEVKNELYAVLGANGAGKTTLMKTLARLLPLHSGSIVYDNEDISGCEPYEIAAKGIAFVPQENGLFNDLTVKEHLSIGGTLLEKKLKKQKMEEVYELFPDLFDRRNQKAGSLSGGESQMCSVGRALMQNPKLILLDEPTAGLSPKYIGIFIKKVKQIHDEKNVSILISEQNATKAIEIADKVMVLKLGKIHLIGDTCDVDIQMIKEGYCIV
jgi:branched-chain amino acid transport system ATP-binding protein